MASYGIGVGRLIACIVENYHDDMGIVWPVSVAPYAVQIISLATARQADVAAKAEALYAELQAAQIEVLFDDRDERAGVKFNDADLLGVPLHVTVGQRSLARGEVELKLRRTGERHMLDAQTAANQLVPYLAAERALLDDLLAQAIPH